MQIAIKSKGLFSSQNVAVFDSFAEAREHAEVAMKADYFEADADHADCADFLSGGQVYAVEPVGFSL